jgi:hypothetical protein
MFVDAYLDSLDRLLQLTSCAGVGRLEGGTHFGMLPVFGTKQEFLERRLWRNS